MKIAGIILLIVGGIGFLYGFFMGTSVSGGWSTERVHNIGLLNTRQNIFIFSGVLSVIGAIFIAIDGIKIKPQEEKNLPSSNNLESRKCPFCAEFVKSEALICRFCKSELLPIPEGTLKTDNVGASSITNNDIADGVELHQFSSNDIATIVIVIVSVIFLLLLQVLFIIF